MSTRATTTPRRTPKRGSTVTPGRRKKEEYLKFNSRPKEVGSRTGKVMPTNVPINDDGFEDPDEFFKSDPPEFATPKSYGRRGAPGSGSSPSAGPSSARTNRSRPGRLSMLADNDEDSGEDNLAAEDLLHDDDDDALQRTPTQPFFQSSPNPPPSVQIPSRSRLPPPSPALDFDNIPSPSRSASRYRKSTIGVAYKDDAAQSGEGSSLLPAADIGDTSMDISAEFEAHVEEGTPRAARSQQGSSSPSTRKKGRSKTPRLVVEEEVDIDIDVQQEMYQEEEVEQEMQEEVDDEESQQPQRAGAKRKNTGPAPMNDSDDDGVPDTFDYSGGDVAQYDDAPPILSDDDDDVSMEEAAIRAENEGESSGEEEAQPKRRARQPKIVTVTRRPRAASSQPPEAKRARVSQLPPQEGPNGYTGDFKTRRSGRTHFRPLEWWRGERMELERGLHGPVVAEVVHIPRSFANTRGRRQIRKPSRQASSRPPDSDDDLEAGVDKATASVAVVNKFPDNNEVTRRIAWPSHMLSPKMVVGAEFKYQKVFGEEKFIAAGVVFIPVGGSKPAKTSRDNAYVFFVIDGVVEVTVHATKFVIGKHGQFLIPRGNVYQIVNLSQRKEAQLFFAQSRKISATEDEIIHDSASETEDVGPIEEEDEEAAEESEAESEPAPPPKKRGRPKTTVNGTAITAY